MDGVAKLIARRKRQDLLFNVLGIVCTLVGIVTLLALLGDLAADGLGRIDWQFLTSFPSRFADRAGILSPIVGTFLVILVTTLTAVPLGVAAGVYLEEYATQFSQPNPLVTIPWGGGLNWLRLVLLRSWYWLPSIIEINIANLAGVPSIIYGLMALGILVYGLGMGRSILAAGLTLAFLILPIVIVATREALRGIPRGIREAAYALGSTKWQVVRHHLLPYSTGGIATGVIIALSRAIGETAPLITIGALTFIAFLPPAPVQAEPPFLSADWLLSPFTVLPIQMFNWVSRPAGDFHVNAAATGLVLMVITLTLNAVAIVVRYRVRRRIKW